VAFNNPAVPWSDIERIAHDRAQLVIAAYETGLVTPGGR
jgi:hypothetical protein